MHDPVEVFALTVEAVASIIDTEPEPRAETPCPEWNYAQLLGHLVGGDRVFFGIITAGSTPPARPRLAPDADRPPPTPADYREVSRQLVSVLDAPEVRDGVYPAPVGQLRGTEVAVLRSAEHLLHGWDLAVAGGAPTEVLEQPATALAGPARRLLAALDTTVLAERRPFGASVDVADGASELDRLVALFGRDPAWRPDPVAGYDTVKQRFGEHPDVELPDGTRHGYGANGMRVRGRVFACPHQDRMMVKLPKDEVSELIRSGVGLPLAKPGQRPMTEWVLVPIDGSAVRRAERAYAFVRSGD